MNRIDEIYAKRSKEGLRPDRVPLEISKHRRQRRKNGESFDTPEWIQHGIINNTEIYDLRRNFAISQTWRCGNRVQILRAIEKHRNFVDERNTKVDFGTYGIMDRMMISNIASELAEIPRSFVV